MKTEETTIKKVNASNSNQKAASELADKLFRYLLGLQWLVAIAISLLVSPQIWPLDSSSAQVHLWTAFALGPVIAIPLALSFSHFGSNLSRTAIGLAQAITTITIVHLMAGRPEAHYFFFASILFLSAYQHGPILLLAAGIFVVDHIVRGQFWPSSIFGATSVDSWKAVEHGLWLVAESAFLLKAIAYLNADRTKALQIIADEKTRIHMLEAAIEKSEEANKVKSSFLASMSHQLRTPMHGILSFANFGLKDIRRKKDDRLSMYFKEIADCGNDLLLLLNDILDLSKLSTGTMNYRFEPNDILEITNSVKSEFHNRIRDREIELVIIPIELNDPRVFDKLRISQVIRNLVANAIKFADARSTITITIEDNQMDQLTLAVANQGISISEEDKLRIFEEVNHSEKKTNNGAAGLSLTICQKILTDHGGEITVQSDESGMTIFEFSIPYKVEVGKISA